MPSVNERPNIEVPPSALRGLALLEAEGYDAWLIGAFVRDALLGVTHETARIATNALWTEVKRIFMADGCQVEETATYHGTVRITMDGVSFKVTTYHGSEETDAHVTYANDIDTDLSYRDFTINALAYHPDRGLRDPFRGARDVRRHIIRCVGNPQKRFAQDPIRILRGIKLASTLGFEMDEDTKIAAHQLAGRLAHANVERSRIEMEKFLCGSYVHDAIMGHFDVLSAILPELAPMRGFDQRTRFHVYDVLEHTAYVVQHSKAEPANRWAALLHDVAKPECFTLDERGVGHMKDHPEVAEPYVRTIGARFGYDQRSIDELVQVIAHHDDRPAPNREGTARLFVNMGYREDLFYRECDLMKADSLSKAPQYRLDRTIATVQIEDIYMIMRDEGTLPKPEQA